MLVDVSYAAINTFSYTFMDRRRVELMPLIGLSAAFSKGQSHWLVIESGAGAAARTIVLRLHKNEYQGVIAALNSKSGKRCRELLNRLQGTSELQY